MSKDKFVLVNLNEAKDLGQVITNDTCLKILDFLADREASESDIAAALNVPLSTVHYNISHLVKGGLVIAEEFHYSPKGKEVNHYKLAHKYIIIAPKNIEQTGLKARLRSLLPATLIALAGTGILSLWKGPFSQKVTGFAAPMIESAPLVADTSNSVAQQAVQEASRVAATHAAQEVSTAASQAMQSAAPPVVAAAKQAMSDAVVDGSGAAMQRAAESAASSAPAAGAMTSPAASSAMASSVPQLSQTAVDNAVQAATSAGSNAGMNVIAQNPIAQKTVAVAQPVIQNVDHSWIMHPATWFLVGAVVVILVVFIIEMIRKKE